MRCSVIRIVPEVQVGNQCGEGHGLIMKLEMGRLDEFVFSQWELLMLTIAARDCSNGGDKVPWRDS